MVGERHSHGDDDHDHSHEHEHDHSHEHEHDHTYKHDHNHDNKLEHTHLNLTPKSKHIAANEDTSIQNNNQGLVVHTEIIDSPKSPKGHVHPQVGKLSQHKHNKKERLNGSLKKLNTIEERYRNQSNIKCLIFSISYTRRSKY